MDRALFPPLPPPLCICSCAFPCIYPSASIIGGISNVPLPPTCHPRSPSPQHKLEFEGFGNHVLVKEENRVFHPSPSFLLPPAESQTPQPRAHNPSSSIGQSVEASFPSPSPSPKPTTFFLSFFYFAHRVIVKSLLNRTAPLNTEVSRK